MKTIPVRHIEIQNKTVDTGQLTVGTIEDILEGNVASLENKM